MKNTTATHIHSLDSRSASGTRIVAIISALLYGVVVWLALPSIVITMDDDFWYLRSAVETIQKGRPWTDQWLTPWAASMSTLVALLFKVSGSFRFAVHFSLALSGALACWGIVRHLMECGVRHLRAVLVAWLLLLSPTVFFMSLMFTSVALYMGCLWCCICLATQRRWAGFFIFWTLGIAARQSAITWLGLAAWPLLVAAWEQRRIVPRGRELLAPLLVIIGGGVVLLALKSGMNRTLGQEASLGGIGKGFTLAKALKPITMGALSLIAGYGSACFAGWIGRGARHAAPPSPVRLFVIAPLFIIAGIAAARWYSTQILWTQTCYNDSWAPAFFALVGAAAGLGLALHPTRPQGGCVLVAMGAWALLILYGIVGDLFDYHYGDAIYWGFAAGCAPMVKTSGNTMMGRSGLRTLAGILAWVILASLAVWDARCYVRQKLEQDRTAGIVRAYENALRRKTITVAQIGSIPFGYVGWKLDDYFTAHEGRTEKLIGGFIGYTDLWDGHRGTGAVCVYPKELRPYREWLPTHNNSKLYTIETAKVAGEAKSRVLWFFDAHFFIKRRDGPGRAPALPVVNLDEYDDRPFPLSDTEWRTFIREKKIGQ